MKNKIFLCFLASVLLNFSICFAVEFSDVSKEHWAYEFINKLSNDGVINGFEDGSFRPSESLTKAQFIKLMVSSDKILIQKMNSLLTDYSVDRQWYESYFDIAENYYLLPENYEKNDLNSPISRKDMSEILSNFIKFVSVYNSLDAEGQSKLKEKLDENPEFINNACSEYLAELDTKLNDSFVDVLTLDKSSQENIFIVKDLGIINGYEDGTFRPYNFVTRAEASKVLSKYIDETGVGIIISNMIYNEAQDFINEATNQINMMEIQMFNSRFEQYEGGNKSKSVANSLVSIVLSSNNSINHKVSVELIDSNGQSILDDTLIKTAISNTINGTTFDISFEKDTKGYINKSIIKANLPINNTDELVNGNDAKTEQNNINDNQKITQDTTEQQGTKTEKVIIDVPIILSNDSEIKVTILEELEEKDYSDVSFWYADYAGIGEGFGDGIFTIKEIRELLNEQWQTNIKSGEEVMIMVHINYSDSNKEDITVTKSIVLP